METRSGKLQCIGNNVLLNGILLARCGESDPLGSARGFLEGLGFRCDDPIVITGSEDTIGGVTVFCIESASRPGDAVSLLARATAIDIPGPALTAKGKKPTGAKSKKRATSKKKSTYKPGKAAGKPGRKKPAKKKRGERS
jgi:hypothetical protein